MTTIEVGMTCRLGKSKNAIQWEVMDYAPGPLRVSLSKLGGDGYVNKTVNAEDLIDVQPRLLQVTLASVLHWQRKVRNTAKTLDDRARFFHNTDEIASLGQKLATYTAALQKTATGYYAGIAEHYPHLIKKES